MRSLKYSILFICLIPSIVTLRVNDENSLVKQQKTLNNKNSLHHQVSNKGKMYLSNGDKVIQFLEKNKANQHPFTTSFIQSQAWNDPFSNDDETWQRYIWLIVLDIIACVTFCMFIQCMLSYSRKAKGNLATYNRKKQEQKRKRDYISSYNQEDESKLEPNFPQSDSA